MPLRVLVARLLNRWAWATPARSARRLYAFAHAEHGSLLDLQAAANGCPDPDRAATYLRHGRDEARHALAFRARANELRREAGLPPLPPARADHEALFERLGEAGFLAFVHRGERGAREQFEAYVAWFERTGDHRSRALFDAILVDERRHEAYTRALLVELVGEAGARAALRRAAAWEAWRAWRRAGRFVAEHVYTALMAVLFVVMAPLAPYTRWARPQRSGWQEQPPLSVARRSVPEEPR